jgi:hypothetical protein
MRPIKPRNKSQLAAYLGISAAAVGTLLKAPDAPAPIGKGVYDPAAVKAFWHTRKALDKAKPSGTYAEELIAKTAAQRALLELELEVKRGNLIERDTVEMQQRAFVQTVQSDLLNMPQTLALMLVGKDQSGMELEIKGYVRRLIESWKKLAKKGEVEK